MQEKKVLFIIAPRNFRDEELFETVRALDEEGFVSEVASTKKGNAVGALGRELEVNLSSDEVKVSDYSAIIFVGGGGFEEFGFAQNKGLIELAQESYKSGLAIGAICIAPRILAAANLAKNRNVTGFADEKTISMLKEAGALFTSRDVERDGRIITANGPKSAYAFGKEVGKALKEAE